MITHNASSVLGEWDTGLEQRSEDTSRCADTPWRTQTDAHLSVYDTSIHLPIVIFTHRALERTFTYSPSSGTLTGTHVACNHAENLNSLLSIFPHVFLSHPRRSFPSIQYIPLENRDADRPPDDFLSSFSGLNSLGVSLALGRPRWPLEFSLFTYFSPNSWIY